MTKSAPHPSYLKGRADQSGFIQECRILTTSSSIRQSMISVLLRPNRQINSVVGEQHFKEQTYIEVFISTFQSIARK